MAFENTNNIYFLGIGGIGMSALARYFKAQGKNVSGYDKTPTALTDELIAEGIDIHFEDNVALIPSDIKNKQSNTLIVYTPAVPASHDELNYFRENAYTIKKRSEVLGDITQQMYTIAVAGTHGKTTVSSMIAHILKYAGMECIAFLGGITKNYNSNLLLSNSPQTKIVVEADEYDRSFLTLNPDVAVITAMDADHLDIYGTKEEMDESYKQFAKQIKYGGRLFAKRELGFKEKCTTYSLNGESKYYAKNIKIINRQYVFDLVSSVENLNDVTLGLPGMHNVENAVVAAAVAQYLRILPSKIKEALASYSGVQRRFDYQIQNDKITYIDDYAHHPEELKACINSVKALYPDKKITGIFQPHLYTRTRDFSDEFGKALSLLDKLILLDIYPARELPIEGVTSKIIFDKVTNNGKKMCSKEEAINELKNSDVEVLLTLGAGDIDQLVEPIKNMLLMSKCADEKMCEFKNKT